MMEANSLAYDYTDGKTQPVVRLRPHHLLCLQNFRGKGYSPAFVEKMTEASACLGLSPGDRSDRQSPGAAILLVQGADDLCKSCPNCIEGQCASLKPARFDANSHLPAFSCIIRRTSPFRKTSRNRYGRRS